MSGRKPKQESRAAEFRDRLIVWKQMPDSLRPSLRALACELCTSHQLLEHYLSGLEEWQAKERYREAKEGAQKRADEISERARAEHRELNLRECIDVILVPGVLDQIEKMRQAAKRGPLHSGEFKILKIWAKQGFPGAQELLERRTEIGVRQRKRFANIVRETPRQKDEAYVHWIRRIWDECEKYETSVPSVISDELLDRLSRKG